MPGLEIWINVVWIAGVLVIAFVLQRRNWRAEKAEEAAATERARARHTKLGKALESYRKQYMPTPQHGGFPQADRDGFELLDLALLATEEIPDPPLPRLSEKRKIGAGDLVRLAALVPEDDDPLDLWVAVEDREGDHFGGSVHAVGEAEFAAFKGHRIAFHTNHIGEIVIPPTGAVH
ncbi:hypothetical protein AADZ90_016740 [Aestuariibius sp. 2305UL40-4]|uniref:hypothetical protein n=1 Tax=Aestuariibius violaceus TaxID=3234132 RepID=UPI00345E82F6